MWTFAFVDAIFFLPLSSEWSQLLNNVEQIKVSVCSTFQIWYTVFCVWLMYVLFQWMCYIVCFRCCFVCYPVGQTKGRTDLNSSWYNGGMAVSSTENRVWIHQKEAGNFRLTQIILVFRITVKNFLVEMSQIFFLKLRHNFLSHGLLFQLWFTVLQI